MRHQLTLMRMPPNPYYNDELHAISTKMLKNTTGVVTVRVCLQLLNPYYNPLSAAVRVARTTAGTHFSEKSKKRNSTCYCGSLVVHLFFLAAGSPVLLWDSGFRSAYYAELSFLRGNTTQQSRHQILSLSVCQVCVCVLLS